MRNSDTRAAWTYHNRTKHTVESVHASAHSLDWSNRPRPYKLYKAVEAVPLPRDTPQSIWPPLSAISHVPPAVDGERIHDLRTLASILHYSAGITKWLDTPGGRIAFRAAACTGALYHIELYVVCGQLPGLAAGVYQYGAHDEALRPLRVGDYRKHLSAAAGGEHAVSEAPVTVVCTSTFWRNSWKYQERAYRHCFWDSGTILANMLAMASAHRLPARVVAGFVDDEVNRLLDVDARREVAVSMVPIGHASSMSLGRPPAVERIRLETVPLSRTEADHPAIRAMHVASSLPNAEAVSEWRAQAPAGAPAAIAPEAVPLRPLDTAAPTTDTIEKVIRRRGSLRSFHRAPVSFEALSTMLAAATQGIRADFRRSSTTALNTAYLIVNAVDGLLSGAYVFDQERQSLERLKLGDFREEAGYLALGQSLGADASFNVFFLADLGAVMKQLGNRGYRAAQLDASITAGKLYLAAYALRLGATGLTFFDDDVVRFFSPHGRGKSVMFLIAVGVRGRPGRT